MGEAVKRSVKTGFVLLLAGALTLTGCSFPAAPTPAPVLSSASSEPVEAVTVTPLDESQRRALFDDKDLNSIKGAAGLAYSPQEALIAFDDDPKCGYTLDRVSLVREAITLEMSSRAPQAAGRGPGADLVNFTTNIPAPSPLVSPSTGDHASSPTGSQGECQRQDIRLSYYKLTLKDPLFVPGQSYPITMRIQGQNHTDQLVWKDAKK